MTLAYTVQPMTAVAHSTADDDTRAVVTRMQIDWRWPDNEAPDWTKVRMVRTVRSPAVRPEEGLILFDIWAKDWASFRPVDRTPYYEDGEPVPDEWNFYTIFLLNGYRVWERAGTVGGIAPGDNGWTFGFTDLMPGASVSPRGGVLQMSGQQNELVQFTQPMGFALDRAVSIAESMRSFWEPRKCAPTMLPLLSASWGYQYDDSLGMIRAREVLHALRVPDQGNLASIGAFASAVTGTRAGVRISDNLMLDPVDASFETNDKTKTRWGPLEDFDIYQYASDYPPLAPQNVMVDYYARTVDGKKVTLLCGFVDRDGERVLDPIIAGVPVGGWKNVRMGCYARASVGTGYVKMGIDLYDHSGTYIQKMTVYDITPTTVAWGWYGNGDERGTNDDRVVPIVVESVDVQPGDATTEPTRWYYETGPQYASPQDDVPAPIVNGMQLSWEQAPQVDGSKAFFGISSDDLVPKGQISATYHVEITATGTAGTTPTWRAAVAHKDAHGVSVVPDGTPQSSSFEWFSDTDDFLIGVEAMRPEAGWSGVEDLVVESITITRKSVDHAYAVPWIEVGDATYMDLINLDEG